MRIKKKYVLLESLLIDTSDEFNENEKRIMKLIHKKYGNTTPNYSISVYDVAAWLIDDFDLSYEVAFELAKTYYWQGSKLFKELFPDVIIIAGGFHATNATHEVLECPSIDFVARGQGEVAFVDFMLAVEADTDPTNIKGIYNLKKILLEKIDISSVKSSLNMPLSSLGLETCTPINNLDDLPFPDRTIIYMKAYSVEQGRTTSLETTFSKKKASIITTRGCYFACTFCASRTIFPRKMQYRSTENVIDEIRELHKNYQINFLVLEDDLFTGNKFKQKNNGQKYNCYLKK